MTPVYQTIFDEVLGNCTQACIASVLDLPLERVPNFAENEDYFASIVCWLNSIGLSLLAFDVPADDYKQLVDTLGFSEAYIVGGATALGGLHHVVHRRGQMVHDPSATFGCMSSLYDVGPREDGMLSIWIITYHSTGEPQ